MYICLDIGNLTSNFTTGIANYVYCLLEALLDVDKDNKYKLLGITPLKLHRFIKNLKFKDYSNVEIKSYQMPSKAFHRVFSLWQSINFPPVEWLTGNIDIFHSFDWYFPPVKSAKAIATIFDITPLSHPKWHTRGNVKQHTKRLKTIKKNADIVTTISKNSKKDIIKYLKIDSEKVFVIYPGVNTNKFHPIKNKYLIEKTLNKYDLKPGYILYVGTIEARKNIETLLKSITYLNNEKGVSKKLVLVGRKGKSFDKLSFSKNVVWTDYVSDEDLIYLYNVASCFVYPSLYEGFGLPVLEAMACGCPVIASNTSSLPEVVGDSGILINPDDSKMMANAIKQILANSQLTRSFINKGYQQVKKFTWKNSAIQTLQIYNSINK